MKTMHLLLIIFSFALAPILFNVVFGSEPCPASGYVHYGPSRQSVPCYLVPSQSNPTLEEQLGNPTQTKLVHDNAMLVLNQTTKKLVYQSGEEIIITPELINIGNKSVSVGYLEPEFFLEIKNQAGEVVWLQHTTIGWVPEFAGTKTLKPGEHFGARAWTTPTVPEFDQSPIRLDAPGNYTAISVATITIDTNTTHIDPVGVLWSKPLQIIVLPEKYVENETSPVIITQVELDSSFLLMPDNQTCTLPAKPGFINNCRTDLIPGKNVQCSYFIGSSTCEPLHQYTSSTNQSCFGPDGISNASQWFDLYNTQNKTVQIQLFQLIILQGEKSWGNEGLFPTTVNLRPHEKCTIGLDPVDGPVSLDQTNMGFAASYTFEGKNYTVSTPFLTDLYNDTRTWQYDGNKWAFAEQNTVTIPEFPFAIIVLAISLISLVVFLRIKSISFVSKL